MQSMQVILSTNRNSQVGPRARLNLERGNLVLRDYDTAMEWSTNVTAGKSITSIEMQPTGNLVMRNADNQTLWESFNHPNDTLVPGQNLTQQMALVAGSSPSNTSEGNYMMVVKFRALVL